MDSCDHEAEFGGFALVLVACVLHAGEVYQSVVRFVHEVEVAGEDCGVGVTLWGGGCNGGGKRHSLFLLVPA